MYNSVSGDAAIKPEFLIIKEVNLKNNVEIEEQEPETKKSKQEEEEPIENESNQSSNSKKRGQNKNKDRPRTAKLKNEEKLCVQFYDGEPEAPCSNPSCRNMHDIQKYLGLATTYKSSEPCFNYISYGKCIRGLACVFSPSHTDSNLKNVINYELWSDKKQLYESLHGNILNSVAQKRLRTKNGFDFSEIEKICEEVDIQIKKTEAISTPKNEEIKTIGPITDEDEIPLRSSEIKKIEWKDKLYLSPLTTVGNLPFRRLCVDFGADITCSEMSLATSIVQGAPHEFALHKRHPCEKIFGIQLCANNPRVAAKACHVLEEVGINYDFVDLNMGCPLENIYRQGAGSGLMPRTNRVEAMARSLSKILATKNKPFTMKMRAGVKIDKYIAHNLITLVKKSGVSAVTLHGRTKEQRYTKNANWNYIKECAKIADPMPLFGNGDILSWEDYEEKKSASGVTGIMIGRGALMKPWIFQEIKEKRHLDLSSSQRLEIVQRYSNYGLDHWGSDYQGVETTRRFLLEWLSFAYRYIPHGILLDPPQKMNQRPPKYFGRDDMETLLASGYSDDWVKISEMFLGPIPTGFKFQPKHKANAWN